MIGLDSCLRRNDKKMAGMRKKIGMAKKMVRMAKKIGMRRRKSRNEEKDRNGKTKKEPYKKL